VTFLTNKAQALQFQISIEVVMQSGSRKELIEAKRSRTCCGNASFNLTSSSKAKEISFTR
jgi:hypothetical protein